MHKQMGLDTSNSELQIPEEKLECPVCAQSFISNRSLYGHTRNHPERNWRGIMQPPNPIPEINTHRSHLPVSGFVASERNHSIPYTGSKFSFPVWSKTGRRTKIGKAAMLIPASRPRLSRIANQAHNLPNLEYGNENLPPKKRKLEAPDSGNTRCSLINTKKPIACAKKDDERESPGPGSSTTSEMDRSCCPINPMKTRKQHAHTCDVCYRSFRSYQALGGHKAHHYSKARNNGVPITIDDESMAVYGEPPEGGCSAVGHQCPFCYKIFSKKQALGGHKRHCRRHPVSGGGLVADEKRATDFSFDLNELPHEWLDPC